MRLCRLTSALLIAASFLCHPERRPPELRDPGFRDAHLNCLFDVSNSQIPTVSLYLLLTFTGAVATCAGSVCPGCVPNQKI